MTYRPQPKYASKDSRRGPWSTCDCCGMIVSGSELQWQMAYKGGPTPVKTGFLKCSRCLDGLNGQRKLLILPVDPAPFFNVRPENYAVDETNWMTTETEVIIDTESGQDVITNLPNPANNADTAWLITVITAPSASVSVLYLDLFNGDPLNGGVSILATVTGSATRSNIASLMELTNGNLTAVNPRVISVVSASLGTVNVSHVGFYSAASGGTLLMSGAVSTLSPTIVEGAAVQFGALGITINLAA